MYWFRKSLWNDQPMVKIDFNLPVEQPDKTMAVPPGLACYTNCDSVEFFQNDKSLGETPLPRDTRIIKVAADPAAGPIKAVGKKDGQALPGVADVFANSGPPTKIELWRYPSLLGPGDGPNVAQIEISLLDRDGLVSRDAANEVTVALDGPGRILAIESGDVDSTRITRPTTTRPSTAACSSTSKPTARSPSPPAPPMSRTPRFR